MSRHDDTVRLRHMRDAAKEAVGFVAGMKRGAFGEARVVQLALIRLVEVIGEAAGRVSKDTQLANPEIPRPQIVGMRNRLIHGYDLVDNDVLWATATEDLPALIDQLERLLGGQ